VAIRIQVPEFGFTDLEFKPVMVKLLQLHAFSTLSRWNQAWKEGKNVHGGSIKLSGYSPGYRDFKNKRFGAGRGNIVDLTLSGAMLASVQIDNKELGAEIFFQGNHPQRQRTSAENTKPSKKISNTLPGTDVKLISLQRPRGTGVKATGGAKRKTKKASIPTSSSSVQSNADLAQDLHDRGFTEWFELDEQKDVSPIVEKLADAWQNFLLDSLKTT
jgi:hypothetical protein